MTTLTTTATKPSNWNVPNLLTSIRFVLAIAVIALIAYELFWVAMATFAVAACTDWIDGYWARKYDQVTKLGRIFDPFVDKIIICGTFIALVSIANSGVAPWMAVVIVGRELLVTSLRGMIEGAGGDFSARSLGKWKMVLQCLAVIMVLICLALHAPAPLMLASTNIMLWAAVALTIYSGVDYILVAVKVLGDEETGA